MSPFSPRSLAILSVCALLLLLPVHASSQEGDTLFTRLLEAIRSGQQIESVHRYYDWSLYFDADQLRLLRNAIYARHGYAFRSNDLDTYFRQYEWYKPKPGAPVSLTDTDTGNLRMIQRMEVYTALKVQAESIQVDLPFSHQTYVGLWQDSPLVASGYGHTYSFFSNGAVVERTNEMDGQRRLISQVGEWSIENGFMYIRHTHRIYLYGGELVKSSGSIASPKMLVNAEIKFEKHMDYRRVSIGPIDTREEFGMTMNSFEMDGLRWYRVGPEPTYY